MVSDNRILTLVTDRTSMYERILLELLKIVELEGIDRSSGRIARVKAIHEWMDSNLVKVKLSQSIIRTNFTSEEEDALKYHLASKIGEKILEDAAQVSVQPTEILTEVVAFKRLIKP